MEKRREEKKRKGGGGGKKKIQSSVEQRGRESGVSLFSALVRRRESTNCGESRSTGSFRSVFPYSLFVRRTHPLAVSLSLPFPISVSVKIKQLESLFRRRYICRYGLHRLNVTRVARARPKDGVFVSFFFFFFFGPFHRVSVSILVNSHDNDNKSTYRVNPDAARGGCGRRYQPRNFTIIRPQFLIRQFTSVPL